MNTPNAQTRSNSRSAYGNEISAAAAPSSGRYRGLRASTRSKRKLDRRGARFSLSHPIAAAAHVEARVRAGAVELAGEVVGQPTDAASDLEHPRRRRQPVAVHAARPGSGAGRRARRVRGRDRSRESTGRARAVPRPRASSRRAGSVSRPARSTRRPLVRSRTTCSSLVAALARPDREPDQQAENHEDGNSAGIGLFWASIWIGVARASRYQNIVASHRPSGTATIVASQAVGFQGVSTEPCAHEAESSRANRRDHPGDRRAVGDGGRRDRRRPAPSR